MIKKKVSPKGTSVRVTFELPADAATESVAIVGDFNEWNPQKHTMKLLKKGVWKRDISLGTEQNYEFRYLVDGETWLNDEEADNFVANEYFSENCVLAV